ncbi:MAG: hypothetical protein PHV34_15460, partial [Verrucomicrobiae bacterium]|nr:hypothetical protein [Verrucomicrobiae bacterium]
RHPPRIGERFASQSSLARWLDPPSCRILAGRTRKIPNSEPLHQKVCFFGSFNFFHNMAAPLFPTFLEDILFFDDILAGIEKQNPKQQVFIAL